MEVNPLQDFLTLVRDNGFVLFFALYSLLRHDRTLRELTSSIIELRLTLLHRKQE